MKKIKKQNLLGGGLVFLAFSLLPIGLVVSCGEKSKSEKDPIDQNPDNKPNNPDEENNSNQNIANYQDANGIKFNSKGEITGYSGTSKIINITNQLIDVETSIKVIIKSINDNVFNGIDIEELTFEENSQLETIGHKAFFNHNLKNISIPRNVKHIGSYAFSTDKTINNQTINFNQNDKLTEIQEFTFSGNHFKEIVFPKNIKWIKVGAFRIQRSSNIIIIRWSEKINYEKTSFYGYLRTYFDNYTDNQLKNNIFETQEGLIFDKAGTIHVIRDINSLTNLIIGEELVDKDTNQKIIPIEIAGEIFRGSWQIKKLEIPKTIKKIGKSAFHSAISLKEFKINLKENEESDLEEIEKWAFNQTDLQELDLSKTKITHLSDESFWSSPLKTIYLPKHDFTIGRKPFEANQGFQYFTTKVYLPKSIIEKYPDLKNMLFGTYFKPADKIDLQAYEEMIN